MYLVIEEQLDSLCKDDQLEYEKVDAPKNYCIFSKASQELPSSHYSSPLGRSSPFR